MSEDFGDNMTYKKYRRYAAEMFLRDAFIIHDLRRALMEIANSGIESGWAVDFAQKALDKSYEMEKHDYTDDY